MNLWYRPSFLALLFFVLFSFFALKDLLKPGLYTSHDGETHTARIAQYYQALKDGQYPPRFAGTFYNGLGSPIFVYIYPLPYLLGSILHFLGLSFVNSFKVIMATEFLISGLFCYVWLKELFKSNMAAFLGTLYYTWSPYKFLLIYVRGSLSENTAYAFVPLVFYCVTKFIKTGRLNWWSLSALSYALLLLSQNLVALIVTPLLVLYTAILIIGKRPASHILSILGAMFVGSLISSFTYIPSVFERNYVRFDNLIGPAYASHFPSIKQLLYSPWGYGFDLPGTLSDAMSFQIGLSHILIFFSSLILFLIMFFLAIARKNIPISYLSKEKKSDYLRIYFASAISSTLIILLIAETSLTKIIWHKMTLLQIIDIPWRLLGLLSITIALIAAFFAKHIRSGFIFLLLTAAVLIANRNHLRVNKNLNYSDDFFLNYTNHATYYSEFNPAWRGNDAVPVTIDPKVKYKILEGQSSVNLISKSSKKLEFAITTQSPTSLVRINKSYFPGVKITDNGQELTSPKDYTFTIDPINPVENSDSENPGLIMVKLAKGQHNLEINFSETPLRAVSNLISLTSFLLAIFLLLFSLKWLRFSKVK